MGHSPAACPRALEAHPHGTSPSCSAQLSTACRTQPFPASQRDVPTRDCVRPTLREATPYPTCMTFNRRIETIQGDTVYDNHATCRPPRSTTRHADVR